MFKGNCILVVLLLISINTHLFAQNYAKMGQIAMMNGNYSNAINFLEKANVKTSNNVSILWMLGYCYFTDKQIFNAIETFDKLLKLVPNDAKAYYFRGKSKHNLVLNTPSLALDYKDITYQSAISDFTVSIKIGTGTNVNEVLQNRGLAYKDYAVFKAALIKRYSEKKAVVDLFIKSNQDFNKILDLYPQKKDIRDLVQFNLQQISSLR